MFPERFTVGHEALIKGAKDSMGVPIVSYSASVDVSVYGWASPSADDVIRPELSGVERDLDLYAKVGFTLPGDRVTVAGQLFTVIGYPEDYGTGPFGYRPGVRVNLKKVEG